MEEKYENFLMDFKMGDELYDVSIANSIKLTEEQPDEVLLNRLAQKEVIDEKGVFAKRMLGIPFLIAAIGVLVFVHIRTAYIDTMQSIVVLRVGYIVSAFLLSVGGFLIIRNKAVKPISAFIKYWKSYFNAPGLDIGTIITPSSDVSGLFFPLAKIIKSIQLLYPVNIEINEEEIGRFIGNMTKIIEKNCAVLPQEKGNENLQFVYGVTLNTQKLFRTKFSKINETLLSIDGDIDIFRLYSQEKTVNGNCIRLNTRMYFVKLGKYWTPVNPIPRFVEFNEEKNQT